MSDPSPSPMAKMAGETIAAMEQFLGRKLETFFATAMAALEGLERRVAELESSRLKYDGVHEPGKRYAKGTLVTFGGSVWHCNAETTSRPGENAAWMLAVKRGKDAS